MPLRNPLRPDEYTAEERKDWETVRALLQATWKGEEPPDQFKWRENKQGLVPLAMPTSTEAGVWTKKVGSKRWSSHICPMLVAICSYQRERMEERVLGLRGYSNDPRNVVSDFLKEKVYGLSGRAIEDSLIADVQKLQCFSLDLIGSDCFSPGPYKRT
eukprot:CAMPEP_0119138002 /NCGR_PEP_ID=MMETSP1310-20130426/24836_1 /TAXON_ID=464262 /ORGANISM="Genus nov. species nov., Strain RCC2339" /LENGTH=157 /DNA_ID=CAMNT_0007129149 /DNA_START=42 /DNA_END=512 /DNA_ORIENTATION=+